MMSVQRPRTILVVIALACGAPTCQDLNPEFVEEAGDEGTGDEADTSAVDDGVATTGGVDDGADGSGSQGGSDGPDDTGPMTSDDGTTTDGGDATTTEPTDTASGSDGSSEDGNMCPDGELFCPGPGCIDPLTNADHCGRCGNKCNPAQEHCELGMCVDN